MLTYSLKVMTCSLMHVSEAHLKAEARQKRVKFAFFKTPDGGGPYTGVSDGRILRWGGGELGWIEYAFVTPKDRLKECKGSKDINKENLCGRPLGLQFNKRTRDLYIADAYFGLLIVHPGEKFATPIVTQAQGKSLHFTNSLDIDQDSGIIYFTDSSMKFQRREFLKAIISGDKTGRVLSYNPQTKEVKVLLNNLSFPNGIALSQGGTFLLIAETTTCRILRYGLQPAQNKLEVVNQLMGFPDNIKPSPRGGFWVAIHSKRGKLLEWFFSSPTWLREVLVLLPLDINRGFSMFSRWIGKCLAVRVSEDGGILEVVEGFGGNVVKYVSEVEEGNGTLWCGSVLMPYVGVCKL
ncbi:protein STRICTOSIDINE SYNTHASE-LIKE 10-like [Asparagus officinalis]|uniref:protein STRICTOSIDINE SYNTHASE-LIKE 10-like n=1 Tax=Asparagus officinalis TaxID=4686 RepID=UPI00098E8701|nr:protein STRICTOSIDINE SYNTHASE-LIKE 10-like [Asparagus officinalis]